MTAIGIDELLTVEQVAKMMRVNPRTIRNRIHAGLLPASKMVGGKDWRVRRGDAEGLLRNATLSPVPSYDKSSGLIDRLGTPEGRARALAILDHLGEDWDAEEQRAAWEVLKPALENSRAEMRQWDPDSAKSRNAE